MLFIVLSACDNSSSNDAEKGMVLPGGYIVDERVEQKNMESCINYAETAQKSMNISSVSITNDQNLYASAIELTDGGEILQICTADRNGKIVYSTAKKK